MSGEWLRLNGDINPTAASLKAVESVIDQDLGWAQLPFENEAIKDSGLWLKKIKKSQTTLAVLGIGGSHLGLEGIYDFLKPEKKIVFFSNVDGYAFEKLLNTLNLKQTHFLAISKSGGTSETLIQLSHIMQVLKSKKMKFRDHISVITEDKVSSLKSISDEWGLNFIPMPKSVGGRFSVLTTVGLAPLMWAGVNVKKLLQGAQDASEMKAEVGMLVDFYLNTFKEEKWISVFWFYCESLKTFRHWVEQLWSESLAKKTTLSGAQAPRVSTPLVCIGANDQHSLLQQFNEGAQDKSFLFIRNMESEESKKINFIADESVSLFYKKSVGELLKVQVEATNQVMKHNGNPTQELIILDHSPQSIGALIYFFELLIASIGARLNINAYDQPGVEQVKKIVLTSLTKS